VAFTVIVDAAVHPAGVVYVTEVVPPEMPASTPVVLFIVPTAVLLLAQVPPAVALLKLSVDPLHKLVPPVIGVVPLTVTVALDEQDPEV
jgi:hypothetical protein